MVTADDFRSMAARRGIEMPAHSGGALRVDSLQLREAIGLANGLDLVILGLDGLMQDGAVLLPLDDFVADLGSITGSWEERVRDSAAAADEIAAIWGTTPPYVELTLGGLDE